jgi:hypothetical protein
VSSTSSLLPPRFSDLLFLVADTIVFLSCDIIALALQGVGGGMVAGADRGSDAAEMVCLCLSYVLNERIKLTNM